MIPRGHVGVIQLHRTGGLPVKDRCPLCGAWHGVPPLHHIARGARCTHDPNRPCRGCGKAVGALTVGGPDVCLACDLGQRVNGKETEPMTETATPPPPPPPSRDPTVELRNAAPKKPKGTIARNAEVVAMQRIVGVLEALPADARARVLEHVTKILEPPSA